jgi:hypothetical protein
LLLHAVARSRSSDGCDGRLADGKLSAVLNVSGVALPGFEGRSPSPMIYDEETPDERVARRAGRWMPAVFVETSPSA